MCQGPAVQSQVTQQGPAGREIGLGDDVRTGKLGWVMILRRGRRRVKITGWMQSGELQRRAAGNGDWLARATGCLLFDNENE